MGHEDFNKTELLLRKDSYVVPWSDPIQREYGEVRPFRNEQGHIRSGVEDKRYGDLELFFLN